MRPVFITSTSSYLPNAPLDNESIERVLGQYGDRRSRARAVVLRANGILSRHYAIDPATGSATHTNAQLAAAAVNALDVAPPHPSASLLSCGSSSPDMLVPSHGDLVLRELNWSGASTFTAHGVCVSGMMAFKNAFLHVATSQFDRAFAVASECASSWLRSSMYSRPLSDDGASLEAAPVLTFQKDFLRFMLSDGAGAVVMSPIPRPGSLSLRIEWVDQLSYANDYEPCMYAGAIKNSDGSLTGMGDFQPSDLVSEDVLAVKQDVRILEECMRASTERSLAAVIERRRLASDQVQWYLPHYSSKFFREKLFDVHQAQLPIPYDRWFTNLPTVGNVGSASFYLMLDELVRSGRLQAGDGVLGYIPESGRFSVAWVYLRAVQS